MALSSEETEETSMEAPYIVLEVWHQNPDGSKGICGYVGIPGKYRWPLVADKEKAHLCANDILADVAASQYLSYLRNTQPERLNTTSIKHVVAG